MVMIVETSFRVGFQNARVTKICRGLQTTTQYTYIKSKKMSFRYNINLKYDQKNLILP